MGIGTEIKDDVSLADAVVSYDTSGALDAVSATTYVAIHGVTSVGELGLMAEAKDKTNLADKSKKYGAGMQDAPDKTIKGQAVPFQGADGVYLAEYTAQKAFMDVCRAKGTFMVKVEWADGETDEFLFKSLGLMIGEPKSSEWKEFSVSGKQNSDVTNTPPTVA